MFQKSILYLISFYQKVFSPDQGVFYKMGFVKNRVCTFYPSCSEYCKEAIVKYGVCKGLFKGARRITRCHPWQKKHVDLP